MCREGKRGERSVNKSVRFVSTMTEHYVSLSEISGRPCTILVRRPLRVLAQEKLAQSVVFGMHLVRISARTLINLTDVFHGFPQSPKTNATMVPQILFHLIRVVVHLFRVM